MNSICVIRLSAIGDVCNAVAAIQAIQQQHPKAQITWVIGKLEYALLEGLPGVEFIVFDKSLGQAAFKQFKQHMSGRHFDVLLHMQVALRASRVARLVPASRKIGFDWSRAKELHSLFVSERIAPQQQAHVLEGFFGFAEKLGVPPLDPHSLNWNIPIPENDQAFALAQIPPRQRSLIITPCASKTERNWLPERYAALADHAHAKGFHVLLCGGPNEAEQVMAQAILRCAKHPIKNLSGQTKLKQLLALLGRASLVLAPDTGPAHMAVTQGTPVLGLYAHSNPARTGPYLYQTYVVEVYHHFLAQQQNKTSQQAKWGQRVKGTSLMHAISVEHVTRQFDRMVEELAL